MAAQPADPTDVLRDVASRVIVLEQALQEANQQNSLLTARLQSISQTQGLQALGSTRTLGHPE